MYKLKPNTSRDLTRFINIVAEVGEWNEPQGHDGGGEGDESDGVEAGEVGEEEVDGGEDDDEVGGLDGAAAMAGEVVDLLEGVAAGDHVDDVDADLHHQLLRDNHPQAQLRPKRLLTQLVVPVEPLPWHCLVHLHHLPQRVQRYYPRQHYHRHSRSPVCNIIFLIFSFIFNQTIQCQYLYLYLD